MSRMRTKGLWEESAKRKILGDMSLIKLFFESINNHCYPLLKETLTLHHYHV
jgi:hypothetical protein